MTIKMLLPFAPLCFFIAACATSTHPVPSPTPTVLTRTEPAAATPAPAAEAKPVSLESVTCTLEKDERLIETKAKEHGCEVQYTKAGKTTTVATDKSGTSHCEKTLAKMKGKLEAGGYKCK